MADRLTVSRLSRRQRALICNGAGPKGWGWLVPDLAFKAAADQHDLDYWQGGRARDKVLADWRFCNGCLAGAWRSKGFKCAGLIALSFIYFVAVFAGGWTCFHFGHKRGGEELMYAELSAYANKRLEE